MTEAHALVLLNRPNVGARNVNVHAVRLSLTEKLQHSVEHTRLIPLAPCADQSINLDVGGKPAIDLVRQLVVGVKHLLHKMLGGSPFQLIAWSVKNTSMRCESEKKERNNVTRNNVTPKQLVNRAAPPVGLVYPVCTRGR